LNKKFSIIDTGGLTNEELPFAENIKIQVGYALDEADVILFVVSAKDGINENDLYVAKLLRKFKHKKIILVGNKSESDKNQNVDFYQLGFGKIFYISAEHGIGVGDLLDEIVKLDDSKPTDEVEEQQDKTSFCIIGRTNVGKSTLMNAILNKERSLVSEQEHSTHDAIDEDFEYEGKQYTIIDTAGIRRKGKIVQLVERFSVMRTEKAISRSKVVILLLDGSNDFNEQDEIIGGLAFKANIPTIICVNK
jgi:GTP-binding protein